MPRPPRSPRRKRSEHEPRADSPKIELAAHTGSGRIEVMAGYGQFCPVAQALEIIGERWTLLVVRELLCGSSRFGEIARGVPLMSRSMLVQRLRTLEDAGVLQRVPSATGRGHTYVLTRAGEELRPVVESCGAWGQRWARRRLDAENLDAALLMWDMRRNIRTRELPRERTVVQFVLKQSGKGQRKFWLCVEQGGAELCLTDPGFDVDLVLRADLRALTAVWLGDLAFERAVRDGSIVLEGRPALRRAFPSWLALSVFAGVDRP
jgi:DNA-binding HxlR family transcriptional regulator